MAVFSPILSLNEVTPGSWFYRVGDAGSQLCFSATWSESSDTFLIVIEENGARATRQMDNAALYPVSQIDIKPNLDSARFGVPLRSGMLCASEAQALLIFTMESMLCEVGISDGICPQDASNAITFSSWDLINYGLSGTRTLISVSV